jgi:thymidylate kinase
MSNRERDGESPRPGARQGFHRALDSLTRESVRFRMRKLGDAELPMEGELDVWLEPESILEADAALARVNFHHFVAPGHGNHRFYVSFEHGRWLKLDAKLAHHDSGGPSRLPLPEPVQRLRAALARRRLAGLRRLGPVIATLGPDGAGKGRVIADLRRSIPVAVTTVNFSFRRGGTSHARGEVPPGSTSSRLRALRDSASVLRKAMWYWSRLLPAYVAAWRGDIVLCDRHPIEVLAVRPDRAKPAQAIERFLARRLMPRPDALILLDAPAEILFQRKGEHSIPLLELWRMTYADVFVPLGGTIVATNGSPAAATAHASEVVWDALRRRRAW